MKAIGRETVGKMRVRRREWVRFFALAAAGLGAGFCNGLLGAGGGIVLVVALSILFRDDPDSVRDQFATTITAILPITLVSFTSYLSRGLVRWEEVGAFLLPALIGGGVGAFLLSRIDTRLLKLIFALLTGYAGFNMLF